MANRSLATMLTTGLGSIGRKSNNMSLVTDFRGMFGPIRESFAGAWQRNVTVDNNQSLLAFSAVYACLSMISSDICKLRVKLMQQGPSNGVWTEIGTSPYLDLLNRPNRFQTRLQFFESWMLSKLTYGNAYVLKGRDSNRRVDEMYVLDPRRVTPIVTPVGDVYYSISADDLAGIPAGLRYCPASEIIHDRMTTLWHPLVGVSPISACGASATQGIRIQANSASFFQNMSRPSGMLTAPGTIDEVTANRIKTEWESNYSGANLGRLAIMGDGLEYAAMTIPAGDAQLIEQLRWTVEDVARAFRVPLHRLGAGTASGITNVESLESLYYSDCIQVFIEAIELCLDQGLELPSRYATEFDLRGLLRMDTGARYDALSKAVNGGWLSPNESRRLEDLPPVEGGETPYLQQQNYSLGALAKRDAAAPAPSDSTAPAEKMLRTLEAMERAAKAIDLRDRH